MVTLYLYSLLAGMLAANGVPHFVRGITGRPHITPFGNPSSPVVNVAWGWFNFLIAALLLHFAHPWDHLYRAFGLFALGVLIMGLFLSYIWSTRASAKGKPSHTK